MSEVPQRLAERAGVRTIPINERIVQIEKNRVNATQVWQHGAILYRAGTFIADTMSSS